VITNDCRASPTSTEAERLLSRIQRAAARLPYALALLPILLTACALPRRAPSPAMAWSNARQLVLVTTADWNAGHGELRRFSFEGNRWQAVGTGVPVVIGRAGAAWGIGLHPQEPGPVKREGDGRSPAGVFAIGTAFGYAPRNSTRLPYTALTADDFCIDVDGSPLYNRIVDARKAGAAAVAGSTEPMRRDLHADGDEAYKIGFVIEHNPRGAAGAGSCIFAHLWKSAESATAGCTAMAEAAMQQLLDWLRPTQHPVLVLLPDAEYRRLQISWRLPTIPAS